MVVKSVMLRHQNVLKSQNLQLWTFPVVADWEPYLVGINYPENDSYFYAMLSI